MMYAAMRTFGECLLEKTFILWHLLGGKGYLTPFLANVFPPGSYLLIDG